MQPAAQLLRYRNRDIREEDLCFLRGEAQRADSRIELLRKVCDQLVFASSVELLDEIERDGFRVLTHRTSLTPLRKLWLAWRTWVRGTPPVV